MLIDSWGGFCYCLDSPALSSRGQDGWFSATKPGFDSP
jgi:hypothetical protein